MKKILLLFGLFWLNAVAAQCPPPGDIEFNTQGQINAFIAQFPNCTEIQGNLTIDSNNTVLLNLDALHNITTVHGDFTIINSEINDIDGLGALTTVHGNFKIYVVEIPDMLPLSNLEYVDGNFYLQQVSETTFSALDFSNLAFIGGDFFVGYTYNTSLTFSPDLHTITGDFYLSFGGTITNLNIQTVGGDFTFKSDTVSNLSLPLTSIGGDFLLECSNMETLDISGLSTMPGSLTLEYNKLPNLDSFSNLTEVGGTIALDVPFANNINGLSGVDVLHGISVKSNTAGGTIDLSLFQNYTSIDGVLKLSIINLTNLEDLSALTSVKGLTIDSCPNLVDFTGLGNLTTTNGDLVVANNQYLESFNGLGALKSINGEIKIAKNYSLTDLSGLSSVDPYSISYLDIETNENLSVCSEPFVCEYLAITNMGKFYYNKAGCNTLAEVTQSCTNAVNIISGYVYTTTSNNCSGGVPARGVKIKCVSSEGDTYVMFTNDKTGLYRFVLPIGQYTITAIDDAPGFTFLTPSYEVNFTETGNTITHDFCMVSPLNENKIEFNVVALDNPKPGRYAKYSVSYRNIGTNAIPAPFIKAVYDSQYFGEADGTTEWVHEGPLMPLQTGYHILSIYVKESPLVNDGDEISFTVSMNQQPIIAAPYAMKQKVYNTVNYEYFTMFVSEGNQVLIEDKDNYLHYAVYPNQSNGGSVNVLDDKLDIDTFKLLRYDNEASYVIIRNNIVYADVQWYSYTIKPKSNVEADDIIYAKAKLRSVQLYTDTVQTKFVTVLGNEEMIADSKKLYVYPNPASNLLNFESSETITAIVVYNSLGQEVRRIKDDGITQIDISGLAKGVYICQIQDSNGEILTRKIIVNKQ